jgi:hypothetical protein
MNITRKISNRFLLWSFFWLFLLAAWLAVFMHWEVKAIKNSLLQYPEQQISKTTLDMMNQRLQHLTVTYWKVLAASLVAAGIFLGGSFRFTLKGTDGERMEIPDTETLPKKKETVEEDMARRRMLLLLSLLQREGRLVDFLEEDLEVYDDARIGASVRSIQETCKKSLNRYLDPKAVIDQDEGEEITVSAGFDPGAIKLTGNVTGQPPFKGILQHRGWKAGIFDLPALSGTVSADIISPAEVEIL